MFSLRTLQHYLFTSALVCLFGLSNRALGADYQSVDLGSVNVGAASGNQTVTLTFTGLSGQPTFSTRYGLDFTATNPNCDSGWNHCTVTAVFRPTLPGLRRDAVIATDGSGRVLATAYLHGVGLAPQVMLGHGKLALRQTNTSGWSASYLTSDPAGNIYFSEYLPYPTVKRLAVGSTSPQIVLGRSYVPGAFVENMPGTNLYLGDLPRFTVDAAGNLFFYTTYGSRIYKLDSTTGLVSTVAGGGSNLTFTDGDSATSIKTQSISALSTDVLGNVYFSKGNEIDRIDLNGRKVYHVSGNGSFSESGDNALAVNAGVNVYAMTVDSSSNLFLFNRFGGIREIVASSGIIKTVFGTTGFGATLVDGALASNVYLGTFDSMTSDSQDNLYLGSSTSGALWKIDTTSGIITKVAGQPNGYTPAVGLDSESVGLPLSTFAIDPAGNIFMGGGIGLIEILTGDGYVVFPNPFPGNTAASQILTITNTGNQDLHLTSQSISGQYQIGAATNNPCSFPGTVASGARCSILVAASAAGSIAAGSLTISNDALNAATSQTFALQIGYPQALLQSTSLNFGTGTAINDSRYGSVSLSNTGGTVPLVVASVTLSGANVADFTASTGCGSAALPGGSCYLSVNFQPKFAGTRTATLTIVSNAAASPQTVSITGNGLAQPSLTVSPTSLVFPDQLIGQSSKAQTVTITNSGTPDILLSSYNSLSSTNFFISTDTCAFTSYLLRAGQSCSYSIQFKPTSAQLNTWSFAISGTGSGISLYAPVGLSGVGVAKPNIRFIPITPCRVADTRDPTGPFGAPSLAAQATRNFDVPGSTCGVPRNAVAYSINVTAVPTGPLGWITVWPTGQNQPTVSTLNSLDGRVKANAAIIPAGTNGAISLFATDITQAILDINGYFVSVTDNSAMAFYPLAPCRVTDTRETDPILGGPFLAGKSEREIAVLRSRCNIPATAQAYSMNFTVVPHAPLSYLTVWPSGQTRPLVSTLNAPTGTVVANAAIVPAGQGGDINVYATDETDVIIDVNGYFAPAGTGGLSLYPLTPCRVLDSREAGSKQAIDGKLSIPLVNSCGLPAGVQAVVSNATVVPSGQLPYLTLWPDGQTQPLVSTLNALDSSVTSNMSIVPASTGIINAFTAGQSHLILDVSAYFAP